ncbi:S8 family serine peptidase [Bacillus sporothermodurans]|uniref:S8 family serine peptidase n=1 Tax=Heyndrickxia sporothermodurans TaxID=46224 RepID=UPI00192B6B6E|nr:S8 family serine peptidase [Heyndrickxia sporothermodurans]MBL5812466.1 S8 family serine peptidase [Heyndrickxia sporothermodurans]
MKKRKLGNILLGSALTVSLIASSGVPNNVLAKDQGQTKVTKAEGILKNLNDEQRRALKQLEVGPGFVISPDINVNSPELVDVIVEFKQAPAKVELMKQAAKGKKVALSSAKIKVEASHQQFKKEFNKLTGLKIAYSQNVNESKITREYKNAFNGVAVTVPGNMLEELVKSDVVKRIWNNKEIKLDLPKEPKDLKSTAQSGSADSNQQIGADKLHDENVTGKGIKVGVIDTGVDYNHPDLKNAYKGGYDFVDNDSDPMEATYDDWKKSGYPEVNPATGSTYYTSHGTHVSGTIAGQKKNQVDYAVEGVAPESYLYVYRVLGPYGSGYTDDVLAGIDKAVADDIDVINLSLGASVNDALYPTSVAINNAMLSGVVSVVAAGNAGPNENTVGSPGTSALAITVGASDVSQTIATYSASAGNKKYSAIKLLGKNFTDKLEDLKDKSLDVVFVGLGKSSDFEGKDLKGKLALIQRGDISFDEKIQNAKKAGAEAVIVYNNVEGEIAAYLGESTGYIPTFQLSKADGEHLKSQENVKFTFGLLGSVQTEGDHLADFSSRGPVAQNYDIKPDVVAPGVAIFSTYPEYMNDPEDGDNYDIAYTRMQGTSMASPHVAGAAALLLQEHPDYTPFDVKAALMNTADEMKEKYSVNEVGAGRIDVYEAAHAGVSLKVLDKTENVEGKETVEIDEETGSIAFGSHYQKDEELNLDKKVMIENHEKEDKEFKVKVEFLPAKDNIQDAKKNGVEVKIPDSISVSSEGKKEVKPAIHVPLDAANGRYEGYIHFVNKQNNEENYQIPFAIRYTDQGVDYFELDRPAVATNTSKFHPFLNPFVNGIFKLKSPMKTIDILVKDGKTGEPVGFIGSIFEADKIEPDEEKYLLWAFSGTVYPFTNDPSKPIADKPIRLEDGDYIFEVISTDEKGKSYINDSVIIVDNKAPEVTYKDYKPNFYEVDDSMYTDEDGYHALWVHGNVYDSTIDVLKSKGLKYDQSANSLYYYQNSPWPSGTLPVQPNVDIKFGVLPEELEEPVNLKLLPVDLATAADFLGKANSYTFVKEGTEYVLPSYDKEKVKLGDTITMTLNVNNVKKLLSGSFGVEYSNQLIEFMGVKVNKAFEKYAKDNHLKINLAKPKIEEGFWDNTVNVGAAIDQKDFQGFDGDTPFLDVSFKVVNDENYSELVQLSVNEFSYTKSGTSESITIPGFANDQFSIIPKHSVVSGYADIEGFLKEDGTNANIDFSKIGAKVYAQAGNGKKYQGSIDNRGYAEIHGIPVSEKDYDIYVEVPGHLTSKQSVKLSETVDGELIGISYNTRMESNYAGDVNGDGVVDIYDIVQLSTFYGKKQAKVDINQDGIVDEKDVRFIEKNFLKVGATAKKNAKPQEKLGKKGLEDFLRALGLEPKK